LPQAIKKVPMRQCLGCRTMKPKKELLRVVRSADNVISIDLKGKAPGRGAYVCANNPDCLKRAIKSRALGRALSTAIPDTITDRLSSEIAKGAGSDE